ncbi:unnamed protein product [Medioppia subpectinata]|uniref:t-SNARE coiled-coil homology domain-containing protein n=1 Tax=Medioppia subpectinata TaxID=1979941 RepID=A0A7R9KX92_9ACAR|nr:unnamed protein product [Medioppia subpectinata]CAG2111532.1 unnamed protein product [Medioppia subpectinata]
MAYVNPKRAVNGMTRGKQLADTLGDEEDVDDMTFLRHPRQGSSGYLLANTDTTADTNTEWEDRRRQLLAERRAIEERTLESSKVSLGLVYETEKTGVETAEELVRQRETLNSVEEKLDGMNAVMRVSQKHLTSMKSIFGGFKNYFSKTNDTNATVGQKNQTNGIGSRPAVQSDSSLSNTIDSMRSEATANSARNHPFLTQRGIETEDNGESRHETSRSSRTNQINQKLDENLSEIDLGIGRLKNLALGLGSEIEEQNSTLDRITGKAERAEDTLQHQNRQMKRILKN